MAVIILGGSCALMHAMKGGPARKFLKVYYSRGVFI